jgi:hypothetical protein
LSFGQFELGGWKSPKNHRETLMVFCRKGDKTGLRVGARNDDALCASAAIWLRVDSATSPAVAGLRLNDGYLIPDLCFLIPDMYNDSFCDKAKYD